MGVNIRKHLVSKAIAARVTYGGTNPKRYIVIHETANTRAGADANAHGRLQASGNSRAASWHYQVDDKEIVQSFDDNKQCWHAGSRYYNQNSIGIEICVNSDGNFKKAVDNAVELTKQLMRKYNVPTSRVIQHNKASGKDCPRYLRNGSKGINWADFKRMIGGNTNAKPAPQKPSKPVKTTNKTTPKANKSNYSGNSIVEYLQTIGQPSSLAHRKKLAAKHGIRNYRGTAAQNLQLLRILRGDAKPIKSVSKPKQSQSISQMATRIINDPKAPRGHAARRKWLGIDNATYQKVRAEVNRRLK